MQVLEQIEIINQVLIDDSLTVLKEIDDQVIDLVIISPPYFQQRDYGNGS